MSTRDVITLLHYIHWQEVQGRPDGARRRFGRPWGPHAPGGTGLATSRPSRLGHTAY